MAATGRAVYDFDAAEPTELSFKAGDRIAIKNQVCWCLWQGVETGLLANAIGGAALQLSPVKQPFVTLPFCRYDSPQIASKMLRVLRGEDEAVAWAVGGSYARTFGRECTPSALEGPAGFDKRALPYAYGHC